ncbi:MAG: hypothetical protein HW377_1764 [Actinobacteria bacterium]|nr:hypothetical protein [Actinomycetota bacterium]
MIVAIMWLYAPENLRRNVPPENPGIFAATIFTKNSFDGSKVLHLNRLGMTYTRIAERQGGSGIELWASAAA